MIKSCFRRMIKLLALFMIIWLGYFALYIGHVYKDVSLEENLSPEAVIVLTGGPLRIEKGIEIFHKHKAKKLYISGANPSFSKQNLPKSITCCVEIDYNALNTKGNAEESIKWLENNRIDNFVLVTSDYHVPRAKALFEKNLANDITMHIYKVTSMDQRLNLKRIKLVFLEYHKYLLNHLTGIASV